MRGAAGGVRFSGLGFSNTNTNYDNTNTNVSPRFRCNKKNNCPAQTLPTRQKINSQEKALVAVMAKKTSKHQSPSHKGYYMKRKGNIYEKIYSIENLILADKFARKKKQAQSSVKEFDKDPEAKIIQLHYLLKEKRYKTSEYETFIVREPKERLVFRLPYWPDRIAQWAAMIHVAPILQASFTSHSYSCIKGKGIHPLSYDLRNALKDVENTKYCLKLDIRKFYSNIDHAILKTQLRRKLKDKDLLWFLDEIIDSAPGLPIGNYTSQHFSNFYLNGFDHWLKENVRVKKCFRYADDIVILSGSKEYLHGVLAAIREYFKTRLKLEIKDNYQVFLVSSRGIDVVGYRHFHTHVLVRKSIKQNCARKLSKGYNIHTIGAYNGWLKHANTINLKRKLKLAA